jgi:hypothetical protein
LPIITTGIMLRQCIQMAILNYGVGGVVFGKQSEAAQQSVHLTGLRLRENQSVLRPRPASDANR